MKWLASLLDAIGRQLARLGVCGNAGLLVGMLTGGLVGLVALVDGPMAPTPRELLAIWALCALGGWILLLFVFVALGRWSFTSVAGPALISAILASGLTLFLCWAFAIYVWGLWVGIVAGMAVGLVLCNLNRLIAES